jgi:hypothetical protein
MKRNKHTYRPVSYRGCLLDEEGHIAVDENFIPKVEVTFTDNERVLIEKEIATLTLKEIDIEEERWKEPNLCVGELFVAAEPDSEYSSAPWLMSIRDAKYLVCPIFHLTEEEGDELWGDDSRYCRTAVEFNADTGAYTF